MRVSFYTFEKSEQRHFIGSSRIRAEWLVNHWKEAELYKYGEDYDAIIYQKAYLVEHAKAFKGVKIFDICDPDFLHWGYRFVEMITECDVITTSTEELAKLIRNYTNKPVIFISDRHDLDFYKNKKVHEGRAKTAVWFGYSTGFIMLEQVVPSLLKLGLGLIVISDKPFMLKKQFQDKIEVTNYPWTLDTVNDDIIKGDIVVNPQATKGRWRFKSNNKTISAYLLNMPVANDLDHLKKLLDEDFRKKDAEECRLKAEKEYDVNLSIEEYKKIINDVLTKKNA